MSEKNVLILKNDIEKVLIKINDLEKTKTSKEIVGSFLFGFRHIALETFGVPYNELIKFTNEELKGLDELICRSRKVKKKIIASTILEILVIPIFGIGVWLLLCDLKMSGPNTHLSYFLYRRKIIKTYGKNFLSEIRNFFENK